MKAFHQLEIAEESRNLYQDNYVYYLEYTMLFNLSFRYIRVYLSLFILVYFRINPSTRYFCIYVDFYIHFCDVHDITIICLTADKQQSRSETSKIKHIHTYTQSCKHTTHTHMDYIQYFQYLQYLQHLHLLI